MDTFKMTQFAGAGWHIGRRSRNYGRKGLRNPVLVQWIKTSLTIKGLFLCLSPVQSMCLSCVLPKSCAKRVSGSSKYLSRFGQGNRISLSEGGCFLKAVIEVKLGSRDSEDSHVRRSIRPLKQNLVGTFLSSPLPTPPLWEKHNKNPASALMWGVRLSPLQAATQSAMPLASLKGEIGHRRLQVRGCLEFPLFACNRLHLHPRPS